MTVFPTVRPIANGWARNPICTVEPRTESLYSWKTFTGAGTFTIYGLHRLTLFHTILEMAFLAQNACRVAERLPYMLSVVS